MSESEDTIDGSCWRGATASHRSGATKGFQTQIRARTSRGLGNEPAPGDREASRARQREISIQALVLKLMMRPVASGRDSNAGETKDVRAEAPRWKRVLDLCLILLLSPILIPLMALLALLIVISSPGPVLFRQPRVGYRGRRFSCFKFRSMVVCADTAVHEGHWRRLVESNIPMVKMDERDPRLIRGGLLLRASGLDELPQIFNVLRGEMSLVGPRPCLPRECERYEPRHQVRFTTLPGLTGLWQVSGKNKTTFEEMIQLDIQYARTKSLWLDLQIILLTVPTLICQVWETRGRRKSFVHPGSNGDSPLSPNNKTIVLPEQLLMRVTGPKMESAEQETLWQNK
jgi:exopolysaccharide production protein ExoY